jgi:predicted ATPase
MKKCKGCGKTGFLMSLTAAGLCSACHIPLNRTILQGEGLEASLEKWEDAKERRKIVDEWLPLRQDVKAQAAAKGLTHFQMRGPVDATTSEICLRHVGQTKTAEQWEQIAPLAFSQGLHDKGCRHSFDPVRSADAPRVQEYREFVELQVARVREMKSKP